MNRRGNATRASHIIGSALHGATSAECACIAAYTTVMVTVCALDLYWFPAQLYWWAVLGTFGIAGTIILTILDDARFERAAIRARALARRGRIVMHSRALLRGLGSFAAAHRDLAATRSFSGLLAMERRQQLHHWLLEACTLAYCLDRLVADTRITSRLAGDVYVAQRLKPDDRPADLVLDVAAALRVMAEAPLDASAHRRWARLDDAVHRSLAVLQGGVFDLSDLPTVSDISAQRTELAVCRRALHRAAHGFDARIQPDWLDADAPLPARHGATR
jgi:hypothetical protein